MMVLAITLATLAGCPGQDQLECHEVDPACTPLYAPTWDNVFANTLHPKCGTGGGACHEGTGARAGLRLDDYDLAYQSLTAPGKPYVDVNDVACSEVIERIYASSSELRMPRGSSLPDAERCAIAQWVLAGAPGPVDAGVRAGDDAP
jgi:hypothetical protein